MHRKIIIIIIVLILSSVNNAQAPEFKFKHLTVDHGLSANTVRSITQDSIGFLWIGTYDGLCRYDGYNFKIFKYNPNDSTSLSDNTINSLFLDKAGTLWIGTKGGGLNKYDANRENFQRYLHNPNDSTSLMSDVVTAFCSDQDNNLWIATSLGLSLFIPDKNSFINFFPDIDEQDEPDFYAVSSLLYDEAGFLWIGTKSGGLNKFNIEQKIFSSYTNRSDFRNDLNTIQILTLYNDTNGILWIGSFESGLYRLNITTGDFIHYKFDASDPFSISDNSILHISEDQMGRLLICTYNGGLNYFDKKLNRFYSYRYDSGDPESINDNCVYTIFVGNTGIIWLGTWSGGINQINPGLERFIHYKHSTNDAGSLSDNGVYSVLKESDGTLWIGTATAGLNRRNPGSDKFIHYKHDPNDPNSISSDGIYSIIEDKFGIVWIGTDNEGLNRFEKKHNHFIRYKHNSSDHNSISSNHISKIYKDRDGNILIGTFGGGLNKYNRDKNNFSKVLYNKEYAELLDKIGIFSLYQDRYNVLWVGCYAYGLFSYDEKNGKYELYQHSRSDSNSLSENSISDICEDNAGNLWIATYKGLNKFNRESKKFKRYKISDGLPNEVIYGILKDNNGDLWLSTNYGLSKFNPVSEIFNNYTKDDGLQANEFNQWANFKSDDGYLFFGGIYGLSVFNPDSLMVNLHPPPVIISDFQLLHKSVSLGFDNSLNRTVLEKSIINTSEINLFYDDDVITFEFAALDFYSPEKNMYKYFLEGFDRNWDYTDAKKRYATYTNLDHGEYIFKVMASNNSGVWNDIGTSIKLIIHPPWWKTWWAYLIYVVVLISGFYSTTRFYLNRQRLKHQLLWEHDHAEKLEELAQIKSRFFTNISHEFRTPLTLILGPSQKILSESNDPSIIKNAKLIKKNASRILGLINQLLDLAKLDTGVVKLKTSYDNIITTVRGITMSFESLAVIKKIKLKTRTGNKTVEIYYDRELIEQVLINLLSNAFKFTPEGKEITVIVEETNSEYIEIKIRDTGIGISESEIDKIFDRFYQVDNSFINEYQGTGIGLALAKELVELHHGKLTVKSNLGKGTEFTIFLPKGGEHLNPDEIVESDTGKVTRLEYVKAEHQLIDFPVITQKLQAENFATEKNVLLIVEDNEDVRKFIIDSFENEFIFAEAADGNIGYKTAREIIPDIIISDIMMPKMDGNLMTQLLKNDHMTSHIPIILLTARSGLEDKIHGLQSGADDYIIKPFEKVELQVRIHNLITLRQNLQQTYTSEDFIHKKSSEGKSYGGLDAQFMNRVLEVIEEHLADEHFSIENIGKEIGMSRSQIHRKLIALTGKSASLYLRSVRLTKAKKMIEMKAATISEIAYSVGFGSPAYFSKCFKHEFGYSPKQTNQ